MLSECRADRSSPAPEFHPLRRCFFPRTHRDPKWFPADAPVCVWQAQDGMWEAAKYGRAKLTRGEAPLGRVAVKYMESKLKKTVPLSIRIAHQEGLFPTCIVVSSHSEHKSQRRNRM